jgi:zinc transport system permease protein
MPDFIIYALIAGLSLAAVAGPLGSFVVWRRMSYFGDTLAHSALLGIALGILFGLNLQISIIVVCLVTAVLLIFLDKQSTVATDTLLGILAHSTLAIGVVVLAISSNARINLEAYLFGELLTIATVDLVWVVLTSAAVLATLYYFWNQFLSVTVNEELAKIEGANVNLLRYLIILLMALITAVAMKIVGVLLITSLLIIPPAAARQISNSPEQMAVRASLLGCLSVISGLFCAFMADTPVGPTIVVVAAGIFFGLYFFAAMARKA